VVKNTIDFEFELEARKTLCSQAEQHSNEIMDSKFSDFFGFHAVRLSIEHGNFTVV